MSDVSAPPGRNLRRALHRQLAPEAWPGTGLSPLNRFLVAGILLAVVFVVVESEPSAVAGNERIFAAVELVLALVFGLEYAARAWVAVEAPPAQRADQPGLGDVSRGDATRRRLRYLVSATAIIDLAALLSLALPMVGIEGALFRIIRLLRILQLARLGRYSEAMGAILGAMVSRRFELAASAAAAGLLLLLSSTMLYVVEGGGQPETFGSIPRAMWWSAATLTTVGYGDAVPTTGLGRVLAGLTAVAGIGLIAVPTGILAAAFSDAMREQRAAPATPHRADGSDLGRKRPHAVESRLR